MFSRNKKISSRKNKTPQKFANQKPRWFPQRPPRLGWQADIVATLAAIKAYRVCAAKATTSVELASSKRLCPRLAATKEPRAGHPPTTSQTTVRGVLGTGARARARKLAVTNATMSIALALLTLSPIASLFFYTHSNLPCLLLLQGRRRLTVVVLAKEEI